MGKTTEYIGDGITVIIDGNDVRLVRILDNYPVIELPLYLHTAMNLERFLRLWKEGQG